MILTTNVDIDRAIATSPKAVDWHTKISPRIIVSGFLNHVHSCKTGSEVDTVMIKLVFPRRGVGIGHARQRNATVSTDYCVHFISGYTCRGRLILKKVAIDLMYSYLRIDYNISCRKRLLWQRCLKKLTLNHS